MDQAENPEGQKINVEQDEMYALQSDCTLLPLDLVTLANSHPALGSGRSSNCSLSSMNFVSFISMP